MLRTKQHLAAARKLAAPLLACFALTGCSLLTIKSPEIPPTPREQEARLLTRDYAAHFATTTSHTGVHHDLLGVSKCRGTRVDEILCVHRVVRRQAGNDDRRQSRLLTHQFRT
jgi:hypothetical protein